MQTDATCWAQQCCVLLINNYSLKAHANGPNIVGQQHPTL